MSNIEEVVSTFGGRQFLGCYRDLNLAIEIELMYLSERPQMKLVCAEVCHRVDKSWSAVSKSLSRAIDDLWSYGERDVIEQYCNSWAHGKPTPHEFIYAVATQLRYNQKIYE